MISDGEVETKMALQRTKQRELIGQLKLQLEDLEKYAYETGGAGPPQSVILERQNLIISKCCVVLTDSEKPEYVHLRFQLQYSRLMRTEKTVHRILP